MLLTTKARYAIMAIVDIAGQGAGPRLLSLHDIASRQSIKPSYLEQLFAKLRKAGVLIAVKGPGGGYGLSKEADQIKLIEIIRAVEENIKMTRCGEVPSCMTPGVKCQAHYLWKGLERTIANYFDGITVQQVLDMGPQTMSMLKLHSGGEG